MVTDDYKHVYLLEVNRKPAFYDIDDKYRYLLHKNLEVQMIKENVEIIKSLSIDGYKPKLKNWI